MFTGKYGQAACHFPLFEFKAFRLSSLSGIAAMTNPLCQLVHSHYLFQENCNKGWGFFWLLGVGGLVGLGLVLCLLYFIVLGFFLF